MAWQRIIASVADPAATVAAAAEGIRSMRVRGAGPLAAHAVQALCEAAAAGLCGAPLAQAAARLQAARPSATSLQNAVQAVHRRLVEGAPPEDLARRFEAWRQVARASLVHHVAKALPADAVVLTHCHSSTVVEALVAARPAHVWCTETRPFWQGRITSAALAREGMSVTLVVDSAVEHVLAKQHVTHVLVGADTVGLDASLVNKVGTCHVAATAKALGIPVWCLATTLKRTGRPVQDMPIEERDAAEVWDDPPEGVAVWNPVFDALSPSLVSTYWTEHGPATPDRLAALPPWEDAL